MNFTPLHNEHLALGAKMAEFAGYDMPIQYAGIKEETAAVRQHCGIFDVSHMGELRVKGAAADAFLNYVLSRTVDGKKTSIISYAILLYPQGSAVDDLLVYRVQEAGDYWLVVNAANKDKDLAYLQEKSQEFLRKYPEAGSDLTISDESALYGQVAIQGPEAPAVTAATLLKMGESQEAVDKILSLKGYRQYRRPVNEKVDLVVSRTGYTGEDGFEIYAPAESIVQYWQAALASGAQATGLGARDALRLEAGMPLYGHELSDQISPLEAGLDFAVKPHEPWVVEGGQIFKKRRLISLISEGRAIPRENYPLRYEGKEVGYLTSGSFSPTLNRGIANALVPVDFPEDASDFTVEIHRKDAAFKKTQSPFVSKSSH